MGEQNGGRYGLGAPSMDWNAERGQTAITAITLGGLMGETGLALTSTEM